jgi:polyphosphate kinase 2 (PPK2 family)
MAENLPHFNGTEDATDDFWEMRFHHTRNFEKELAQNGTTIFKFYLHLSKEEQKTDSSEDYKPLIRIGNSL